MKLEGLTIIVTGATSGIGLALAERLAGMNNRMIAVGRNEAVLQALQARYSTQVHLICADLSNSQGVDGLVQQVEQHYPRVDLLINNAAVQYNYSFLDDHHTHARIQHEVYTNLTAPITLAGLLLPHMLASGEPAAIVNVTSGLALQPKQSAPVYCASKAGLHTFTKALRYQLEGSPVKVFELMLPLVDTPMTTGRGRGKISTDAVVNQLINGLRRDCYQIYVGKVKLLRILVRWLPGLAERILKNS